MDETRKTNEIDALNEVMTIKKKLVDVSKNMKGALERISADSEEIKLKRINENTMKIGRDSAQALVELKNVASEIFSEARENKIEMLNKEFDIEPFTEHINELKKENSETRQCINMLKSIVDGTAKLIDDTGKGANAKENESSSSSVSIVSSDPSISEFSLFDGSSSNAATSSPICKREDPNQDRE